MYKVLYTDEKTGALKTRSDVAGARWEPADGDDAAYLALTCRDDDETELQTDMGKDAANMAMHTLFETGSLNLVGAKVYEA